MPNLPRKCVRGSFSICGRFFQENAKFAQKMRAQQPYP
jgi:hypothetical protein